MANVTKTPSAVVLTGTAEKIALPALYAWVWVRNDSENVVYISQTDDVGENVAGTIAVPAGGAARLALFTPSFYALGTGAVQISAANYADCPFKTAPKGGEQHGDPEVLDKLGEDESGALTYGGEAVGGGGSGLTLIGTFNIAQSQWTDLGVFDVGTILFITSATLTPQTSTTPSACTTYGFVTVPENTTSSQTAYFKILMMTNSGVLSMNMSVNSYSKKIGITGNSNGGLSGAFNVYKVEVATV